jgi:hypothetical protein
MFDEAVYPTEAQRLLDGIVVTYGLEIRLVLTVKYKPDRVFQVMMFLQPIPPIPTGFYFKNSYAFYRHDRPRVRFEYLAILAPLPSSLDSFNIQSLMGRN